MGNLNVVELIGYFGSALVVVSMLMTSVVRLRVINLIGSAIFAAYALIIRSYPTALMNVALMAINVYHLVRLLKEQKQYKMIKTDLRDGYISFLLDEYGDDIRAWFPEFSEEGLDADVVNLMCCDRNPAGLFLGRTTAPGDVEVLPVTASHAPGLGAMIYAIRRNGRTVLIANDTGWLTDEAWTMLEGVRCDAAVIECTTGFRTPDACKNHQGFNTTLKFRERLIDIKCIEPDTPAYVTHFSHNGYGLHEELQARFFPEGMTVAYDGLSVEI